jgi:formylglycine-generating enzyme required for sulfatase activity
VSREDAAAYAAWAGRRLPTVEELRAAAAGVERLNADRLVCAPAGLESGPCDVDSGEDVAESGALHLGGNVSEWTSTESAAGSLLGVVFGGNWRMTWTHCLQLPAIAIPTETRDATIGFRCARDQ